MDRHNKGPNIAQTTQSMRTMIRILIQSLGHLKRVEPNCFSPSSICKWPLLADICHIDVPVQHEQCHSTLLLTVLSHVLSCSDECYIQSRMLIVSCEMCKYSINVCVTTGESCRGLDAISCLWTLAVSHLGRSCMYERIHPQTHTIRLHTHTAMYNA